jgi:hypothetical protein
VTDCETKELRIFNKAFGMIESSKPLTFRSIRQLETGDRRFPKLKQRLVICSEALIIFGIYEYNCCIHQNPSLFMKFKGFMKFF